MVLPPVLETLSAKPPARQLAGSSGFAVRLSGMNARLPLVCMTAALIAVSPVVAQEKETLTDAASQPLRDLSIVKRDIPEPLKEASTDPYASPAGDCAAMRAEIAELDTVLGADLGEVTASKGSLVTDAVKSAVSLPFSGIIRRLTGAHKRDQAYEDAVIAGVARRAFLKGALDACMTSPPPLIPETTAAQAVVPVIPTTQAAAPVAIVANQ